ncbi:MAG: flagellar biosynthesis protein FlhB [Cellulosilyticum sp.]|nr:flagellar biosynthesis protein FlhB [Cellulosilyticum sp.]
MSQRKYPLNLQFFSAESEGRTEKATAKKREDARKKGQVAQSKELNTAVLIVGFCGISLVIGGYMLNSMMQTFTSGFSYISKVTNDGNPNLVLASFKSHSVQFLLTCLPLWACLMVIAFIICYIQVKWKVSFEPMKFKMSKMNPLNGLKRLVSKDMFINLGMAIGKVILLGSIAINLIKGKIPTFIGLYQMNMMQILKTISMTVVELGFFVGGAFFIIATIDYIYQWFKHEDSIKMTKQEIKEEYKNAEGDPQIKSKIKQKMRQASMQRMMQAIPEADVIITNPTHFAVALKYDETSGRAPIVVAKGVEYVAQKIKEKGKEANVTIVENKPLARSLYYTVDIEKEIPPELYGAVAEVLAFVYNLQKKTMNGRK